MSACSSSAQPLRPWVSGIAAALLAAGMSGVCWSDGPAATNAPAQPAAPLRDPFWPVGYATPTPTVPPPVSGGTTETNVTPTVVPQVDSATPTPTPTPTVWPDLGLKAITKKPRGGGYMALISVGEKVQLVEEGDVIRFERPEDGMIFRWKIGPVSPKGVSQIRLDAKPAK